MKELLTHSAPYDGVGKDGNTPLHLACQSGSVEVLHELLKVKGCSSVLRVKNKDGQTPLHIAAKGGHQEAVLKLIESGARLDAKDKVGVGAYHDMMMHRQYSCGTLYWPGNDYIWCGPDPHPWGVSHSELTCVCMGDGDGRGLGVGFSLVFQGYCIFVLHYLCLALGACMHMHAYLQDSTPQPSILCPCLHACGLRFQAPNPALVVDPLCASCASVSPRALTMKSPLTSRSKKVQG